MGRSKGKGNAQSTKLGDLWHPAVVDPVQNPQKALRQAKTAAMERDPHHPTGAKIHHTLARCRRRGPTLGPALGGSSPGSRADRFPQATSRRRTRRQDQLVGCPQCASRRGVAGHSESDYARHEEICTGVNPVNEDREVIDLSDILPNNDPRVQFAGDSDEDGGDEGAQ